jgi:hypothetical protein
VSDPADALHALAARLRAEDTPISPHVIEPAAPAALGLIAADGPRAAAAPGEYAFVVEAVHEGYLLHYGEPNGFSGMDEDLALLAGDSLYALGLARLAEEGDLEAVAMLADLITNCAKAHAQGDPAMAEDLWAKASR